MLYKCIKLFRNSLHQHGILQTTVTFNVKVKLLLSSGLPLVRLKDACDNRGMLRGRPYQEWDKSKIVKMKNKGNRKDPKRKEKKKKKRGVGELRGRDIKRVKNMERKKRTNKQEGNGQKWLVSTPGQGAPASHQLFKCFCLFSFV